MKSKILAIDPGNIESGYVIVAHDGNEITEIIKKGKVDNYSLISKLNLETNYVLAIEMVASYGMPVGASVFETCVWIGRFIEEALKAGHSYQYIYRKDEKMTLCNNMKAKDANIRQALIDRYAPNTENGGKGTKKNPGFFYGFASDVWSAMAVAVTYFDMYIKGR